MSDGNAGDWLGRLKNGLSKSSQKLAGGITDLFTKRKLDAGALEDLEEILITGDIGVKTAARLAGELADRRFEADVSPEVILQFWPKMLPKFFFPSPSRWRLTPVMSHTWLWSVALMAAVRRRLSEKWQSSSLKKENR